MNVHRTTLEYAEVAEAPLGLCRHDFVKVPYPKIGARVLAPQVAW